MQNQDRLQTLVSRVKENIRVTKVTVTRSVKTNRGDFFVGFSAAWDSVQDDVGGYGSDSELTVSDAEVAQNGMTMEEARVAHVLLSMEASLAAWRSALAEGVISQSEFEDRKNAVKRQHAALIPQVMSPSGNPGGNQ